MSKVIVVVCTILVACSLAVPVIAGKSSVKAGEKLFNDPALSGSKNDKSCASCHPGGEGMEKAGKRKDLVKMVNKCVVGALKGEKIDGRSVTMRSLKMYLESLAK